MSNKNTKTNPVLELLTNFLFVVSLVMSIIVLLVLREFQLGMIISYLFILIYVYSLYLLVVRGEKKPILVTNTAFLLLTQIYAFVFRLLLPNGDTIIGGGGMGGNIAAGFLLMFLIVLLPVFVLFSSINLYGVLEKNRKNRILIGGLVLVSLAITIYWVCLFVFMGVA